MKEQCLEHPKIGCSITYLGIRNCQRMFESLSRRKETITAQLERLQLRTAVATDKSMDMVR